MNGFIAFWDGLGPHRLFFILLVLSFLGHVFFLIFRYRVLSSRGKKEEGREPEGVSVIITSSNKADLLRQNLEYFLRQDYPCFEVVVVDECSEDDTKEVLSDFQERYPNLKTSRIPPETKFRQTKKIAIHIGVLAAQYDVLLFSEIECRPASDQWIRTMASAFGERTAVVLGMANYVEAKGTGLRRYFRFLRFWQMCLLSRLGVHVMADGCNMGYRKKYYLEARGYTENTQSYMGYDSDMVKKLSRKGKVEIVKDAASFVVLDETGRRAWKSDYVYHYVQRRQWPWLAQGWGTLDFALEALFYALAFHFIFRTEYGWYAGGCMLLVYVYDVLMIRAALRKLNQKQLSGMLFCMNACGFVYKGYYWLASLWGGERRK